MTPTLSPFIFHCAAGEAELEILADARKLNEDERAEATEIDFELRASLEFGDPEARSIVRQIAFELDPRVSQLSPLEDSFESERELAGRVSEWIFEGRIRVRWRRVAALAERDLGPRIELPPLPSPPSESTATFFELRVVDEVGQAVSGIAIDMKADGELHALTTNPAGVALLENSLATSATAETPEPEAIDEILDPRWTERRPGQVPEQGNTHEFLFEGAPIGPVPIKAAAPNTLVLKPPLGRLFMQLFDKTGRVRHARRAYEIEGPQSLSGECDDDGVFLHEDVFPGDYKLTLTLTLNVGGETLTDTYESPLVVLPGKSARPEVRMLGVLPFAVQVRLHWFFNTNKTFLLPTALPEIRQLARVYAENTPSQLLVVGHADTAGESSYNDQLSLERAESTMAFLKDDVDAWLKQYDSGVPAPKRWGKAEDRMMLLAMPDFGQKPKGQDAVRWFQQTRGLSVDGKAGPQTRRRLITEYMALDGTALGAQGLEIEATAHGCGEHFPLDDTAESLDEAPGNGRRDPGDRRVELFFFDREFGIVPKPPGKNSKAGSKQYPAWRELTLQTVDLTPSDGDRPKLSFVELLDALFRTNSAVVLPEGEAPASSGNHSALGSVGIVATALRFNAENAGKTLLVAGHTDTTSTVEFNQTLSEERAQVALALLVGDRSLFQSRCNARHTTSDIKQILSWASRELAELGFDCNPGKIDENAQASVEPVRRFQRAYNTNAGALGAIGPALLEDGSVGPLTWGAIFDCYEFALRNELGEDSAGLAKLRSKLVFADDARKALGFSEYFPIEELGVDSFKSQANRRVEIVFFDAGEEPDLEHAENDPETSELYLPGFYVREPVPAMATARRKRIFIQFVDGAGVDLGELSYRLEVDDGSVFENVSPDATVEHHVSLAATSAKLILDDATIDINIEGP